MRVERNLENILAEVLSRRFPDEREYERVKRVARRVVMTSLKVCSSLPFSPGFPRPHLVGSSLRRTFVKGENDLDLFLVYPRRAKEEKAISHFLKVGREIYRELGASPRKEYAQHPYYRGEIEEGFILEVVPSFEFKRGERVKSPVDRSIEHDRFLKRKMMNDPKITREIVLLKSFFKGIGVYGAEAHVGGFSGYLTELITIYYGSFLEALKGISNWTPYRTVLWIERRGPWKGGEAPLVFVDPVDERRNVAAALKEEIMKLTIKASVEFLRSPSIRFFFPNEPPPIEREEEKILRERCFLIRFPLMESLHEEIRYGELERTARGLSLSLGARNIKVERFKILLKDSSIIFLYKDLRREVKKKLGPPSSPEFKAQVERFLSKWRSKREYCGEGEEGGRVYVILRIEKKELIKEIEEALKVCRKGKDVWKLVEYKKYEIIMGDDLIRYVKKRRDLEKEVKMFLSRKAPWEFRGVGVGGGKYCGNGGGTFTRIIQVIIQETTR